jgi:dTDP-4-dehydrorhamnose 3,5-epimerase
VSTDRAATASSGAQLEIWPEVAPDEQTVTPNGRPVASGVEGALHERLQPQVDHRGLLMEVINFDRAFWSEAIVYAYAVTIRSGGIKGWALHKLQHDRLLGARGKVRIVLFDGRVRSPTFKRAAEFHLGEQAPGLLRIPAGVWHAYQNYGEQETFIVNFPTRPFNHAAPDKYRIDPHSGTIPFDWSLADR